MKEELQILEKGPKFEIHLDSPKATFKKYQTGKLHALIAYTDSDLKKIASNHDRLTTETIRYLQEGDILE